MTITLELSPEQEERLSARARAAGMDDMTEYVRSLIDNDAPSPQQPAELITLPTGEVVIGPVPRTGAEALEYWRRNNALGLFEDGPDSPELARQLRRQAEQRIWARGADQTADGQPYDNPTAA